MHDDESTPRQLFVGAETINAKGDRLRPLRLPPTLSCVRGNVFRPANISHVTVALIGLLFVALVRRCQPQPNDVAHEMTAPASARASVAHCEEFLTTSA